jgi:glycerol-3-phosphate dehydrogenase
MAKRFHRDFPALFTPSLAWNVLFNIKPLSDHALAVMPRRPGGQTFFLVPWKGAMLAGTGHAPCSGYDGRRPDVTAEQLEDFIGRLNEALPGARILKQNVIHVFSGYLPVEEMGSTELTHREVIVDHAKEGGPRGLFSVSGIKFTTARRVAEKTLKSMFPGIAMKSGRPAAVEAHHHQSIKRDLFNSMRSDGKAGGHPEDWETAIQKVLDEESVRHLDDFVIRRLPLTKNPAHALQVAAKIGKYLKWDERRCRQEAMRLKGHFQLFNDAKPESLG